MRTRYALPDEQSSPMAYVCTEKYLYEYQTILAIVSQLRGPMSQLVRFMLPQSARTPIVHSTHQAGCAAAIIVAS